MALDRGLNVTLGLCKPFRMPIDAHGFWMPDLVPSGVDLYNEYARYVLLHGPRMSGKSLAADHRICRHLWENDKSRVGIICKTLRNGKVGVWRDLTGTIIPQWIKSGWGFRYTVEPKMEADSKMSFFRVRNMHGGESEVQLHSLEHDDEVQIKFKDTRFSLIYLVEADKFRSREVFDILTDQLRVVEVPEEEYQFIADTNPPEEGEDHWLHDVFMKKVGLKDCDERFANQYKAIYFPLEENQFISQTKKDELDMKYRHNKILHARFVKGLWVRDVSASVFNEVYNENIHVPGDPEDKDPQMIVPAPGTYELFTGWDLGDLNHAFVLASKRLADDQTIAFDILDELVVINRNVGLPEFVDAVLEKMDFWEDYIRLESKNQKIVWRHWSDSSSLRFRSAIGASEAIEINALSNGRIKLIGVQKGAGSVRQRIEMLKKMLFDGRVFVSPTCSETIKMLRHLKPSTRTTEALNSSDPLKHVFDAITYMLGYESPQQIMRHQSGPKTQERRAFAVAC